MNKEMLRNILPGISVFALAFSFAPAEADHTPQWIWEDPETYEVRWVDMNPAGTRIVASTNDGSNETGVLAVFDSSSAFPVLREEFEGVTVNRVAVSDDGSRVACTAGEYLYVYELPSSLIFSFHDTDGFLYEVDFSSDGDYLAVSRYLDHGISEGGRIYLFDVTNEELLLSDAPGAHVSLPARIHATRLSGEGNRIIAIFGGGVMGDPAYTAYYEADAPDPSTPVWITQPLPAHCISGEMARAGQHFVTLLATTITYFDMSPPVGGIKEPLWQVTGGGCGTYANLGAISDDGMVVARTGDYWDYGPIPGVVEVYDGTDGTLLWYQEMEYSPRCDLSPDGSRVAYSQVRTEESEQQPHIIYDLIEEEIIWEGPGFGFPVLDQTGETLVLGAGYYAPEYIADPMRLMRIEENTPPECDITYPLAGDVVSGVIEAQGTFYDVDDAVDRVELIGPAGVIEADLQGSSSGNWTAEIDFSAYPPGDFTLNARTVDSRYKHGIWTEVTFQVTAPPTSTPSVPPTFTLPPSATPAPSFTPVPTPTPEYPDNLTLELVLSREFFTPGDTFFLDASIYNPDPPIMNAAIVTMLEIHGRFFFWPSWSELRQNGQGFDYENRNIPAGQSFYEIIAPTVWPDDAGEAFGLLFYGTLLDESISVLMCRIDVVLWGYGY